MNQFFEERLLELKRKGDDEKVRFLQNLHLKVMPSQLERIQQNDKSVMQDLFMPKWVSWELLRAWADNLKVEQRGKQCVLCGQQNAVGIDFREKFICEACFIRLKNLR